MPEKVTQQRRRPRKLPSQERAQHTVDAIVEAAARILERRGHDGFNTNAVAELAGVSIGTLYQYFPDKYALLGALIARETALLVRDAELAGTERSGSTALTLLIGAAVKHQLGRPNLARVLDLEESRLPLDPETLRVRERFHVILVSILGKPDLPAQADLATAGFDVAAIMRGLLDAAGERGERSHDALMARVRRAVLGYLETARGNRIDED